MHILIMNMATSEGPEEKKSVTGNTYKHAYTGTQARQTYINVCLDSLYQLSVLNKENIVNLSSKKSLTKDEPCFL